MCDPPRTKAALCDVRGVVAGSGRGGSGLPRFVVSVYPPRSRVGSVSIATEGHRRGGRGVVFWLSGSHQRGSIMPGTTLVYLPELPCRRDQHDRSLNVMWGRCSGATARDPVPPGQHCDDCLPSSDTSSALGPGIIEGYTSHLRSWGNATRVPLGARLDREDLRPMTGHESPAVGLAQNDQMISDGHRMAIR